MSLKCRVKFHRISVSFSVIFPPIHWKILHKNKSWNRNEWLLFPDPNLAASFFFHAARCWRHFSVDWWYPERWCFTQIMCAFLQRESGNYSQALVHYLSVWFTRLPINQTGKEMGEVSILSQQHLWLILFKSWASGWSDGRYGSCNCGRFQCMIIYVSLVNFFKWEWIIRTLGGKEPERKQEVCALWKYSILSLLCSKALCLKA